MINLPNHCICIRKHWLYPHQARELKLFTEKALKHCQVAVA